MDATLKTPRLAPKELVERVVEKLCNAARRMPELPRYALRQVLCNLVRVVTIWRTKEVEIMLNLPQWALRLEGSLCLAPS